MKEGKKEYFQKEEKKSAFKKKKNLKFITLAI
jgi:hypothetical protein